MLELVVFLHNCFAALAYILAVSCLAKVVIVNVFSLHFWKYVQKCIFNEVAQLLVFFFIVAVELKVFHLFMWTVCSFVFFRFYHDICAEWTVLRAEIKFDSLKFMIIYKNKFYELTNRYIYLFTERSHWPTFFSCIFLISIISIGGKFTLLFSLDWNNFLRGDFKGPKKSTILLFVCSY